MSDTLSPAPQPDEVAVPPAPPDAPNGPRGRLPKLATRWRERKRRSLRQRLTRPTWTKVVVALLFGIMVAANGDSVAEERLVDVTGELDQAEAALAASEDQVGDLEEELGDREEELGDLESELGRAEGARDDAGKQLEELAAELAEARERRCGIGGGALRPGVSERGHP